MDKIAASKFTTIVGTENFSDSAEALQSLNSATFPAGVRAAARLAPGSKEELDLCLATARETKHALYPVSGGRNWGLGSRLPARDGCVVLDLSRINRILDFDEELGYLTVEPGVTFYQAASFLAERKSKWFLSVIGGPPDASIIGNSLERGEGLGPRGLRPTSLCALEILLANGEYISTGFSAPQSRVKALAPWNVGPSLDGLFYQSNLGIVTKATVWLQERPESFQAFCFACSSEKEFSALIPKLRSLQAQGIIRSCSLAFWNSYKFLASQRQFPWDRFDSGELTRGALAALVPKQWKNASWFGFGALYSASSRHARADRKALRTALRAHTSRLLILDTFKAGLMEKLAGPLSHLSGMNIRETVQTLFSQSLYLGNPRYTSLKSVYWRKRTPIPERMNPDRDRCGVIWLCHTIPFRSNDMVEASQIIEKVVLDHEFEPNIALLPVSERCLHLFVAIVYDREVAGEDARAMKCHDILFDSMNSAGFSAYRLGIQSLAKFPSLVGNEQSLIETLRNTYDPSNILAPGRYETKETA